MITYDPRRWTSHLFDIRGSLVVEILGRVALCVTWSVVVVVNHQFQAVPWLDWSVPETGHALVGGAFALLLVFRTNSSYDRFWEGRKLWGGVVNETRNLVRQTSILCAADPGLVRQAALWTIAFPYACMHRLRGRKALGEIGNDLPAAEVAAVLAADHVPLAVAKRLTALLNRAREQGLISDFQQMQIDQNVQLLVDYIGACERIHSTPMPYAYAVHLRRALFMFCFTLPLALVGRFAWGAVPATFLIAYILFGIEEIGVEIEDPFGTDENDLPLERICENIERTLRDAVGATVEAPSGV